MYAYIVCLPDHLKKDIEKDSVTHKFVNTGTGWYACCSVTLMFICRGYAR